MFMGEEAQDAEACPAMLYSRPLREGVVPLRLQAMLKLFIKSAVRPLVSLCRVMGVFP